MPNAYYNYDNSLTPGALAKAEDMSYQFASIEAGFDQITERSNRGISVTAEFVGTLEIPNQADMTNQVLYLDASGNMALIGLELFSSDQALQYAQLAQAWANTAYGVEVAGGEYSAKHYAEDAKASAGWRMGINNQLGAYTLQLSDAGALVRVSSDSPVSVTVPDNATAAFDVGSIVHVRQIGAGQVDIAPAAGVTINTPTSLICRTQQSTLSLMKVAADEWDLVGDMAL